MVTCAGIVREAQCLYLDSGSGANVPSRNDSLVKRGIAGAASQFLRANPVHGDACLDKQIGIFVGVG